MADISIPAVKPKTYVLKVNLHCCDDCPKKLEKLLMNTNGVCAFKINTKKGVVKIASIVDLDILKETIKKKVGIKIKEIYDPKCDNNKTNRGIHQSHVDNFDDDHTHHGVHNTRSMPRGACGTTSRHHHHHHHHPQNNIGRKGGFEIDPRMFGNYVSMPQPAIAMPPPYYGEVPYGSAHHYGPGVYNYNRPPPIAPPLPPHGYYGSRLPGPYVHSLNDPIEAPKGNSMFHAISDDNVRAPACTIM